MNLQEGTKGDPFSIKEQKPYSASREEGMVCLRGCWVPRGDLVMEDRLLDSERPADLQLSTKICLRFSFTSSCFLVFNVSQQHYWVCMLSHFSPVRVFVTLWTVARQASLSLGFSRQEHWSGLLLPSPMHESEKCKWRRSVQSCPTHSDPMDCSPPASSIHGIF